MKRCSATCDRCQGSKGHCNAFCHGSGRALSANRSVALGPGLVASTGMFVFFSFLPSRTDFHFNMLNLHHVLTSTASLDTAHQILFHDFADGCRKAAMWPHVRASLVSREQPPREPLRIREERRTSGDRSASDGAPSIRALNHPTGN